MNDKRHYSNLFEEYYIVQEDGKIIFDSGAEYEKCEVDILKGLSPEVRTLVHTAKKAIPGQLTKEDRKDIFG